MATDVDAPKTRPGAKTPEHEALIAFVPRLAAELGRAPVPSWTSVDGSMLSADISGFTALSEKLAGKGKAGAEEITSLINTCFTALIDSAYRYGGEVIKFGGDALLILFRGQHHQRRAADAGLLMQRALHSSSAAKRANLTMTVGAAAGPFDVFLVGSGYRELLITGPRATEVIRLEGEAAKGDTLVDPMIADLLPTEMKVREEHGGWVIVGSTGDEPSGPGERDLSGADLRPYLPAAVVEQLAAFAGLGGEHRLVTVGFTMVAGIADQLERLGAHGVAEALSGLVDHVVAACDAFGVTVLHTDIAPDGIKFVLCAGAPVSPGDTTDALLQAALQIATSQTPFVIRQGVQAGRVFAGFLGSSGRRTYTLMGDPVNTAARMLGRADDRDIVAVAAATNDTRAVFETDALEPFLVKGKTEPISAVKVRRLSGQVRRDTADTRLVGRQHELGLLTHTIGELDGVVELVGAAGVGKTRLLDAAWSAAEGLTIYQGACTPYGAASPYGVFRPLLRRGSGIPVDTSAELAGERLATMVDAVAPHLRSMLPLLAVPFGAKVQPTPEADAIDAEFRRQRIHELVVDLLDATLTGPILLVIEDTQWIDDASGELANHLVQASEGRPWAAIITRRPEGSWTILDAEHVTSLTLEPLTDADVRRLGIEVSERPLADRDLDVVVERAQGNPLFAIELAKALSEVGADGGELPDTIEQLIASRFDRLEPSARRLVRVASVLGTLFHEAIISGLLNAVDDTIDVDGALEQAAASGAIARRPGSRWGFNHALYRDTAYQGLPFRQRQMLHRRAAEVMERRAPDTAAIAPLLSLHYSAARAHEPAWRHSLVAADIAQAQNATSEAATALERALHAGRYYRSVTTAERTRVAEELGDLYYVLGRFEDAERRYAHARRFATPVDDVRLMRKLGAVAERRNQPARAVRWFHRAAAMIPATTVDPAQLAERAQILLAEAGVLSRSGDNRGCLTLATRALAEAEQSEDESTTALALEKIQLAKTFLHRRDEEQSGERALAIQLRNNDLHAAARVQNNLGVAAYFESRWDESAEWYLAAIDTAERSGNVVMASNGAINSAEVLADQGAWQRAIELLDGAIRNFEAMRYAPGISAALLFSAVPAMRAGRLDDAAARLARARTSFEELGMNEMLADLTIREFELELLHGRYDESGWSVADSQFGANEPLRHRLLRLRGLGRHLTNSEHAAASLAEARSLSAPTDFEYALTLLASLRVEPDHADAGDWTQRVEEIATQLGVERFPDLVGVTSPGEAD